MSATSSSSFPLNEDIPEPSTMDDLTKPDRDDGNDDGPHQISHLLQGPSRLSAAEYVQLCKSIAGTASSSSSLAPSDLFAPRGIENPKNLCFRNVIIQALLAVPPFRKLLHDIVERCPESSMPESAFHVWKEMGNLAYKFRCDQPLSASIPLASSSGTVAEASGAIMTEDLGGWNLSHKKKGKKSLQINSSLSQQKAMPSPLLVPLLSSAEVIPELMQAFMTKMRRLNNPELVATDLSITCSVHPTPTLVASQEDAMEFMTFLLDALHEEMIAYGVTPEEECLEDLKDCEEDLSGWEEVSKGRGKKSVDEVSRKSAIKETASTPISRIFHGTIRSEFKQQGKMLSATFQRFHCLNIEIRDYDKPVKNNGTLSFIPTVEKALEVFFSAERLSDSNATKLARLEVLPPTLVLQLNRFSFDPYKGTPIKLDSEIAYSMVLNLSQAFLTTALKVKQENRSPSYKLVAVVMHHGNKATGGHYTCFCRSQLDSWRQFDDGRVLVATEAEVLNAKKQAYLLFYCKDS